MTSKYPASGPRTPTGKRLMLNTNRHTGPCPVVNADASGDECWCGLDDDIAAIEAEAAAEEARLRVIDCKDRNAQKQRADINIALADQLAEALRLAYVAMTRAVQELRLVTDVAPPNVIAPTR